MRFGAAQIPTPSPTPTPTPTPTPNPVPNQCNPPPTGGGGGTPSSPTMSVGLVKDMGGTIFKNSYLRLIYWGINWSSGASPSRAQIDAAVQNLISGPFLSKLKQYKGISKPQWVTPSVIYNAAYVPVQSFLGATDPIVALMNNGTDCRSSSS